MNSLEVVWPRTMNKLDLFWENASLAIIGTTSLISAVAACRMLIGAEKANLLGVIALLGFAVGIFCALLLVKHGAAIGWRICVSLLCSALIWAIVINIAKPKGLIFPGLFALSGYIGLSLASVTRKREMGPITNGTD